MITTKRACTYTVAIVDDDHSVRDSLKFLLEVEGYGVSVYASAPAFLEDQGTQHTCMIIDHNMSGMTGLELVARIRSAHSKTPILILTDAPTLQIRAKAGQLGVALVLDKPPDQEELLSFISSNV